MYKSDFPIFDTHPDLIYLDSSATSQKPQRVIDAVSQFYQESNANVHRGIYELSETATNLYEEARELTANFFNTQTEEIIFTGGATIGLNMVAWGLVRKRIKPGKTILVSVMEHHANLLPWQQIAEERGANLEYVELTEEYRLDLEHLRTLLETHDVAAVALTHMSNLLGTINPMEKIVPLVRELSDALLIVDGTQYAPHYKLDLSALDVDFYAVAGHKMLGPTGIGVLFGKSDLLEEMDPFITGGGMIRTVHKTHADWAPIPGKFEAGTPHIAGAIGLGEAIRYIASKNWDEVTKHEEELTEYFLAQISDIPELTLWGPPTSNNRGGVFSFSLKGIHPHDIAQMLGDDHVAVRAGHHCNQILMREVIKEPATVRASLYLYNDYKDIDAFSKSVRNVIKMFA